MGLMQPGYNTIPTESEPREVDKVQGIMWAVGTRTLGLGLY